MHGELSRINLLLKLITILTLQFKMLSDSDVKAITVSISQQRIRDTSENYTQKSKKTFEPHSSNIIFKTTGEDNSDDNISQFIN